MGVLKHSSGPKCVLRNNECQTLHECCKRGASGSRLRNVNLCRSCALILVKLSMRARTCSQFAKCQRHVGMSLVRWSTDHQLHWRRYALPANSWLLCSKDIATHPRAVIITLILTPWSVAGTHLA